MILPFRSKRQIEADKFDAELYHLLAKAERLAEKSPRWKMIVLHLSEARIYVRGDMHPQDMRDTQ